MSSGSGFQDLTYLLDVSALDYVDHASDDSELSSGQDHSNQLCFEIIPLAKVPVSSFSIYACLSGFFYCFWMRCYSQSKFKYTDVTSAITSLLTLLRVVNPFNSKVVDPDGLDCNMITTYRAAIYEFALASGWLTLWLRQRLFYQSPMLKKLLNTPLRIFSHAIPGLVIVLIASSLTLISVVETYYTTECGCASNGKASEMIWCGVYATSFLAEMGLLFLFISPLIQYGREAVQTNEKTLNRAIIRTVIVTIVCITMHFVSATVVLCLGRGKDGVKEYVTDVTIVVQTLAVTWSFTNWRERLFPWNMIKCCCKRRPDLPLREM